VREVGRAGVVVVGKGGARAKEKFPSFFEIPEPQKYLEKCRRMVDSQNINSVIVIVLTILLQQP